jgi:hypothetical protein
MSIVSTITALQALHATIGGVISAPATRPVDRFNASLPCILVRPGALTMNSEARGIVGKVRSYEGVALVTLPNQGRGVSEGITKAQTLMDAFSAFYEAHIESNTALSTGGQVTGYRDGGEPAALIAYGADEFEGFTFSVDVWEG